MTSPTEEPLPPLDPDSALNCWEMLLRAAARRNVITHAELRRMYEPLAEARRTGETPLGFNEWITRQLLPHGKRRYLLGDPAGPQPQRGDVIIWGDGAHVVMATGRTSGDLSPEVYSFWPYPKDDFTMNPNTGSWGTVTDAVQITSIAEIASFAYVGNEREIWFGRGPW